MKKLLISLLFATGCSVALAAEEAVMTFEELDVDKDGVLTMEEATVYEPVHKQMQESGKSELSKLEYEEWAGTTNH